MINNIKLFIQGFIVGLGKIMPGVSGSVMAISFGIYEKLIASLSSIKIFKQNIKFIFILFGGIGLAILIGSNAIKYLLANYYIKTLMFMIGMMIPGIIPLIKNVKNKDINFKNILLCLSFFIGLFLLEILNFHSSSTLDEPYFHTFLSLILCGLLDAASTVIPGISGSALLMLVGYYERIITALANLLTFTDLLNSILTLIPFFIGIAIGIVLTSKLITYLFKHHRALTYMLIIVFSSFSIFALLSNTFSLITTVGETISGILFLCLGVISTKVLEKFIK